MTTTLQKTHENASEEAGKKVTDHFPYDTFRPYQKEAIERAAEAFEKGKKFVVAEMPTGAGKSGIATTLARHFGESYIITAQKLLQEQYIRDFGGEMVDLKGRNAYECQHLNRGKNEDSPVEYCDRGLCKQLGKSRLRECYDKRRQEESEGLDWIKCNYFRRLVEAQTAPHTIFNFSSFLFQANYARQFGKRKLLIVDEAHNIESQIMGFVEITLSDKYLQKDNIIFPKYDTPDEYRAYFKNIELAKIVKEKFRAHKELGDIKIAEKWRNTYIKLKTFMDEEGGAEFISEWKMHEGGYRTVTLKPLYAKEYAPKLLFEYGEKVLLLSATILDHRVFCENLGIPLGDVEYIRVPCTFPLENRPIRLRYVGSMSYKHRRDTMPDMVKKIEKALDLHENDRGIIHSQSFGITNYIRDKVGSKYKKRLLLQEDYATKEALLAEHALRPNGVIVAPAMHEGLDLKGDLSKFQIICKVPYPDANNDKQLKRRTEENWHYYLWLTALKLVQSYGRSVRSEKDVAQTYILDSDFTKFVSMARKMLPPWFLSAILW